MATTTILGTDLELKQRKNASPMGEEDDHIYHPGPGQKTNGEKPTPLQANLTAQRDALVGANKDPYGYHAKKRTVSSLANMASAELTAE